MTDQLTVSLHRWAPSIVDQQAYAALCRELVRREPSDWQVRLERPSHALAGRSRAWIRFARGDTAVLSNGFFTLSRGASGASDLVESFTNRSAPAAFLVEASVDLQETAELLSIWTTAALALEEVSSFDRRRPSSSEDYSVEDFERMMDHPLLRYSAGIGARRRVIDPWRRHISAYRRRVDELSTFWDRTVRPAICSLPEDQPLSGLLRPLLLLREFSHDADIRAEYLVRLERLTNESDRVAARTGSAFGVLAVVVGFYSLPVALIIGGIAAIYFYGLADVLRVLRRGSRLIPKPGQTPQRPARTLRQPTPVTPSLRSTVEALRLDPGGVLVGQYLAVVDYACAFLTWMDLFEQGVLPRPVLTDDLAILPIHRGCVIVGGPLSVPARRHLPHPACELAATDAAYSDWGYLLAEEVLCLDGEDETVGCVAAALGEANLIFVDGFRSIGVEIATDWLRQQLRSGAAAREGCVLLRYDAKRDAVDRL